MIAKKLMDASIRVTTDLRNEKIGFKIREHTLQKVPYILAVGKKEIADESVSVRKLGSDKNEVISVDKFIETIVLESKNPLQNK